MFWEVNWKNFLVLLDLWKWNIWFLVTRRGDQRHCAGRASSLQLNHLNTTPARLVRVPRC